jgi:hypothetical protein
MDAAVNPLIPRCFGDAVHNSVNSVCNAANNGRLSAENLSGELLFPQ